MTSFATAAVISVALVLNAPGQEEGPAADLMVSKTGPEQAQPGSEVTYTIVVDNFGPDASSETTLTDPLPPGTTFVSFSAPVGWTCSAPEPGSNEGTVTCTSLALPRGYSGTFTLVVQLDREGGPGTVYTNIATVSDPIDPNEENNSSPAVTMIPATPADLGIIKLGDKEQAVQGTDVTYTISIINDGPNTAMDATWSDTLPGDLTFVSLKQTQGPDWNCTTPAIGAGGTVTCTNASLPAQIRSTFQLVVNIPQGTPSGTTYTNTATVTSSQDGNSENDAQSFATQVFAAAPTLSTTASESVQIGGAISDAAILSGGASPTGTITFHAYGPDDETCGGVRVFTSTRPVADNGTYNSGSFTPARAGTYRFVASYSGDENNIGITMPCGDPAESVVVTKASPGISTTASGSVVAGSGTISDRADLTNGFAPTGTILFRLFGPADADCSSTPVFASTVTVNGNGQYQSGSFAPTQAGTYRWIASYSGDENNTAVSGACGDPGETVTVTPAPPTPTPSPTATASPSPTATASPSASPSPSPSPSGTPSDVLNLSTRERVDTGENVLIGGFIITGDSAKKIVLRGIAPSLQEEGISDLLPDPVLQLHGNDGSLITANDNWKDDPAQAAQVESFGLAPRSELESAIAINLAPGPYTAIVRGKGSATGLALAEIYDVDSAAPSGLANISTRGFVQVEQNVMIGGFTLGRSPNAANLVVRAIGPTLSRRGIANPLADPTLELYNSDGDKLEANDNWAEDPAEAAKITGYGLAPENSLESAIATTLPPGSYTAIVAGKDGTVGVALIEIYRVQ